MKTIIIWFLCLSGACLGQVTPITRIQTAGGFLDVCGLTGTQLSKERAEALKEVPASQFMDEMKKAMADQIADHSMCIGYLAGIIEGWKEGHEHGVAAAQFPNGWPKEEQKALKLLPLNQLQSALSAMSSDVPCIPDYVTIGQERDIVLNYVREQEKQNPFMGIALMPHTVYLAFQAKFPCPTQPTAQVPTAK